MKQEVKFVMRVIKALVLFLCALSLLQLCSCVNNTPPPDTIYSDSYTTSSAEQYTPLDAKAGMTEREAVNTALSNNPGYKKKQLEAVSAQAGYYSSLNTLTPNVSINSNSGTTATYQVSPSNVMNVPAAKADADKARYDSDNYRREMLEEVNITYDNMQKNQSIAAIQKENEAFQY